MAIGFGVACPKPESRLHTRIERNKSNYRRERIFKADVWARDHGQCRSCEAKVIRCVEINPKRGEVHHLESRLNHAVRYDPRNGVLLCAICHEDVERCRTVITGQRFTWEGRRYLDAAGPLKFRKAEK